MPSEADGEHKVREEDALEGQAVTEGKASV